MVYIGSRGEESPSKDEDRGTRSDDATGGEDGICWETLRSILGIVNDPLMPFVECCGGFVAVDTSFPCNPLRLTHCKAIGVFFHK
eukprot:TRINITY_DN2633_c0_g1_i1.p1 TRINITY_DN2633_c0_g1~~TRINITY_DN2633_c0_g1_i1.p1  ORF type:complete len:85 (-),score=15.49 TRINITY_DN2633_c0_g1_i1:449-703(-)